MREYYFTLDEGLKAGIRPEHAPANAQILNEALGFRAGKIWLEPQTFGSNPMPVGLDIHYNWPFPQFIFQQKYRLLIVRNLLTHEDLIYTLNSDYTVATFAFSIDWLTFGIGTLFEVADFGDYCLLVNGVSLLYWSPPLGVWHASPIAEDTIPLMRTICNFKGQLIGGGITSVWHDCDETYIIWGKIGSADFTPDRFNTAGYRQDLFGGSVYHARRLEDQAIIYSSRGITRMYPAGDPAVTFGFEELHDVGLINRGAVDGNLREQVFVDAEYNLWKIGVGIDVGGYSVAKVNPKMLGYSEYLSQLTNDILVRYDPRRGDFYIGDDTRTFILTSTGLTEVLQHPSAVWNERGELHMLPDSIDDEDHLIVSEIIDFGIRGSKTIFTVEVGANGATDPYVAIDWRMSQLDAFQRTSWVPVNNEGVASIIISGIEFRLCFKCSFVDRVDYITARYKMTDMRSIRGVYAPPPRGQSAD